MNPKTPQDLDPKLKEAYDRVMGGNFNPSTPTAPPPNLAPKIENPLPPAPTPIATNPQPLPPPTNPVPVNMPPLNAMSPSTTALPEQPASPTKKKFKFSPIIFIVVGLVFFAVYAVVWGKIFNLF